MIAWHISLQLAILLESSAKPREAPGIESRKFTLHANPVSGKLRCHKR